MGRGPEDRRTALGIIPVDQCSLALLQRIVPDCSAPVCSQHKDYPHSGRSPGKKLEHYLYPENIYIACYYRDMTEKDGPTQVVPGSHVDPSLVPTGIDLKQHKVDWPTTTTPFESFCCRKQDCIMWDQRLW